MPLGRGAAYQAPTANSALFVAPAFVARMLAIRQAER
jgi:hypothetical protein